MIAKRLSSFMHWLIAQERSPRKLALAFCMGIYIAFSPFIGLHTVMTFVFSRLFALNLAVLLAISVLINNPWTMVPVYSMGHLFGSWFFKLCNVNAGELDPAWVESCNSVLQQHIGISGLSLSAFLVGGNLLGALIGVMLYPVIKYLFTTVSPLD